MAVTLDPVVALSPVAGDQLYVLAPLAVKLCVPVPQKVPDVGVKFKSGNGFTVTPTFAEAVQLLESVATTLYVVDTVGDAVTLDPVVALKPEPGDQL